MDNFINLILIASALILSSGLFFSLKSTDLNNKYWFLKPLTFTPILWGIFVFLGTSNVVLISQISMFLNAGFTFILVFFSVTAIMEFEGQKTDINFKILAIIWATVLFVAGLTNNQHEYLFILNEDGIAEFNRQSFGPLFIIHTFVSYAMLAIVIVKIMLNKKDENVQNKLMKNNVIIGYVVFASAANIINNMFLNVCTNLNFLIFAIYNYLIYSAIYRGDIHYRIVSRGRKELLEKMKEMYILSDIKGNVLEVSKRLKAYFIIDEKTLKKDEIINEIKKYTVLYKNIKELKNEEKMKTKPYFLIQNEKFKSENNEAELTLFYDETENLKLINELNYLKKFDIMTGVFNRNHFEKSKEYIEKNSENLGVIIIDLDELKLQNDKFGHQKGDEYIMKMAKNVKKILGEKKGLEAFRLGGDEFLITISDTTETPILEVIKCLKKSINKNSPEVKYSVGASNEGETLKEKMKLADKRMYENKSNKKRG